MPKLTRDEFIAIIAKFQEADRFEHEFTDAADKYFDCRMVTSLSSQIMGKIVIDLLNKMFDLPLTKEFGSDIEYFIYELDYGKNWKPGSCWDNGKEVDLSDSGKLYDYITRS